MKNKSEQIALLRAFLVTQMNHWIFFPVYVTCMVMMNDIIHIGKPYVFLWLILGILPFLLYWGRQNLKKVWMFVLLHLGAVGVMFLIPAAHVAIKTVYVLVGVLYAVYSCYLFFKTPEKQDPKIYPLFSIGISLAMLYFLQHQGHDNWDGIYVAALIVTLGLYFIVYYIERYQNFLKVNHSSAGHIPATEMFRSGMGLVLGYTGIGVVILILISNIHWLKGILNVIKTVIYAFLSWLSSLFPKGNEASIPEGATMQGITQMEPMEIQDDGKTFWLWNVLDYVMEIIIIVAIAIVTIKLLLFLYKLIKSKLKRTRFQEEANASGAVYDVHEDCGIIKKNDWNFKIPFIATNPKERIRQMYKKRILASQGVFTATDKSALNRYTARECEKILEREEFAAIYEKARYSNTECNHEDVKCMRNACK